MEDKENAPGICILGENTASPKGLRSPNALKQIDTASSNSVFDFAENKIKGVSLSQAFLHKRNTKDTQLKTTTPNPGACLSEKRVPGSYRGKIVSSKINSFRNVPRNVGSRNSLAAPPKSVVRTGSTGNSKCTKDTQITSTVGASKAEAVTSVQTRPPVKVSVSQPKAILNPENQSARSTSAHKGGAQINFVRNWKPVLKSIPASANSSVHATKKPPVPKTVTGNLAGPASQARRTVSTSKSFVRRETLPATSSQMRRTQLAEWRMLKGIKKPSASISADTQPETETAEQMVKEPTKSFWAAIAEEDEQGLITDKANKTLAECLSLIEMGSPGTVHHTLETLILTIPDAKKLAKYWVCQMRLEQFHSTEKVLCIYENAVLAGAQPTEELRHVLVEVMKSTANLRKSDEELVREQITQNDEAKEGNLDKNTSENISKDDPANENEESSSEEDSQKATDACLKSEQEKNEQSSKPLLQEKDQSESHTDEILESKSDDKVGSYLIKYNLSTTPFLESAKKKLQCESNDSAIKDLKFLTPVRRSRRIHQKLSKLPDGLKEQSPCVSSLEQLEQWGDASTGFIYRPNSALKKVSINLQEQYKE
ncbi:cytoskeleton-associated protein 2 [Anolis carolinensis]|uniref:Cytoskeleton-associated protein 2 C-terminal domain-containing protein n=1 Tax=Anolis carolinensis TaxID=28377 RepID=G1KT45_ANOCA|nr:PREDICTED: cytoskeleton-associated protein 2 [Anolis carolinensis]|eukprot:XP_008113860.1 PREDICTED: cytoskeleton-associated protein 2 [Anolis carolinensis]